MSDFPVIPVSRSKSVTHCSLPAIIAMAWAWRQITHDQLGIRDLWPQSPSLWNTISTVSGISQPKLRNSSTQQVCQVPPERPEWIPWGAVGPWPRGA